MDELIEQLREGPAREGEGPDGIELFDLDSAREAMHDAADEIERLRAALLEIASMTQSTNLLWWQEKARTALGIEIEK